MREDLEIGRVVLSCLFMGMAFGFIGAVPVLWIPNMCCLIVVAGGAISALAAGWGKKSMEIADGVIIGFLFGLLFSFFNEIAFHLLSGVFSAIGLGLVQAPDQATDLVSSFFRGFFYLILNILRSVVFGGVGGLLYVMALRMVHGKPSVEVASPQKRAGPAQNLSKQPRLRN